MMTWGEAKVVTVLEFGKKFLLLQLNRVFIAYTSIASVDVRCNFAESSLEKLQVPEGWCSWGRSANEYTAIQLGNNTLPYPV